MGVKKLLVCAGLTVILPVKSMAVNDLPSSHKLMQQWITLEQQKGSMLEEFQQRKEALELQLSLLELEEKSLQQIVEKLDSNTDEVEQERLQLIEHQNKLEQDQTALQEWLNLAAEQLVSFSNTIPPPLQGKWQENIDYINQNTHTESERLERVLSTISLFNEFNDRIAVHESAIELPNAQQSQVKQALVKQVYLGASAAWYVSQDGTYFGYGQAINGAWHWWHGPETTEVLGRVLSPKAVLEVIAIIENPATAQLSSLPIALQKLGSEDVD